MAAGARSLGRLGVVGVKTSAAVANAGCSFGTTPEVVEYAARCGLSPLSSCAGARRGLLDDAGLLGGGARRDSAYRDLHPLACGAAEGTATRHGKRPASVRV